MTTIVKEKENHAHRPIYGSNIHFRISDFYVVLLGIRITHSKSDGGDGHEEM